ncbi:hypothetical protein F4778DRAFT_780765 [Xylariomycetidae sp. FL2044]|nr:hypothetical protein F4778DRAFT_780765 [Xylariomycetidae sp. FL2044]
MLETFLLFGIGVGVIALRTYARIDAVGVRKLQADDYIMLLTIIPYAAQSVITQFQWKYWHSGAMEELTEARRATLDPSSKEWALWVREAKLTIASLVFYVLLQWMENIAMLVFFLRLTDRLGHYRSRIYVGFVFVVLTWLAILSAQLLGCRPLHRYWQVWPDPGNSCNPGRSHVNLFVTLSLNIATDLYIFSIPLPILWTANIQLWKKLGLLTLIFGNIFVIVMAIVRCYMIIKHPARGPLDGVRWSVRISFVAVASSNLPLTFPLIQRWFRHFFPARPHHRVQIRRELNTITVPRSTHTPEGESPLPPVTEAESYETVVGSPFSDKTDDMEMAQANGCNPNNMSRHDSGCADGCSLNDTASRGIETV